MGTLERINPLLMYNVLVATRRFEPDFYAHLCRAFHLDADRILGLFSEVDELGVGQLGPMLKQLREHQSYHDIMYLAGRNSFHMYCEEKRVKMGGGVGRFAQLVKQVLPPFLGLSAMNVMLRGSLQFVELSDSIFSRGIAHPRAVCGFYCGFLAELGQGLTGKNCAVTEIRCRAVEPDATSCLVQVAI